jgi:hypothetical protein
MFHHNSELADNPPSVPLSAVVGRETVRCVTSSKPNSFFVVDLLDRRVLPSHYTLRHYSSWHSECVRHWTLSGSKYVESATCNCCCESFLLECS